jgi:hypothetical protein
MSRSAQVIVGVINMKGRCRMAVKQLALLANLTSIAGSHSAQMPHASACFVNAAIISPQNMHSGITFRLLRYLDSCIPLLPAPH